MIPIPKHVRSQIIDLLKNGKSTRTVAELELAKVSQSTVWRLSKTLNIEQVRPAAGRQRSLDSRIQRKIGRFVESGKVSTAVEATQQIVAEGYGLVCPNTVRRGLGCDEEDCILGSSQRSLCFLGDTGAKDSSLRESTNHGLYYRGL